MPTATFDGFPGGMNQALSPADIRDDEVVDALNMELTRRRAYRSRNGVTNLTPSLSAPGPISSVFHYRQSALQDTVLFTSAQKVYRKSPAATTETEITNSLSLPTNGRWQWGVLGGVAIGVNGSTTHVNPVKLTSTAGVLAALGGSPPKAKYIEVLDSRVFLVSATEPNKLHWSALGDHEDYTTPGKSGAGSAVPGGNNGDEITGIKNHKGTLFIFMRRQIWYLKTGSPNTDASQWEFINFTAELGTVSGFTVQTVLDDLVFLADEGLVSLQNASVGNYRPGILSDSIPVLTALSKSAPDYSSIVHPEAAQYWIAVPAGEGVTTNDSVYVFDYTYIGQGIRAWTRFDGLVVGRSYGLVYESGRPRVYVGGTAALYRYGDEGVFTDAGTPYRKLWVTKAFGFGASLARKEFFHYGVEFSAETDPVVLNLSYRFDEDDSRLKTLDVVMSSSVSGGVWDSAVWDEDTWATDGKANLDLVHRFQGPPGRRAQTLQFMVQNNDAHGFSIKRVSVDYVVLNRRYVSEASISNA